MKRISKLLCIILVLGIFILMNQITANADLSDAVTSCEFEGASGQELTYTLNYTTGVMEISGEGAKVK